MKICEPAFADGAGAGSMDDAASKLSEWHATAIQTYEAQRSDYQQKWAQKKADDATGIAPF